MISGPQQLCPEGAVIRERTEEGVYKKQALEGDPPAPGLMEPPDEAQRESPERGGGDGEDREELVDITLRKQKIIGGGCLYEYEVDTAEATGCCNLGIADTALLPQGREETLKSPGHDFP
ncbi:hypothetical protein CRG98_008347 [Punica granatum]|uniref:Uncharacterized protein n=1 Tax=Punica granatum TaxID=22663 RepID=A0A2I0KRZ4_PUNGR|nr:hypothetical protein CRG98_008347 [Punica granatum]